MQDIHGRWKIEVSNQVVMQWFADSWNEEAIIAYVKDFQSNAKPLSGSRWAIISVLEDWQLGVPAIESHVVEHCRWFLANGCVRDCHVYTPDALKKMQLEKMIPHSEGNYTRCIFTSIEEAIQWLEEEGFSIANPQFLYDLNHNCSE